MAGLLVAGAARAEGPDGASPDAFVELEAGRAEHAAQLFAQRMASEPGNGLNMLGRVRALLVLDRWAEALDEARGFAAAHAGDAHVETGLAEALFRAGRLREVEPLLERLTASKLPPPRAMVLLARLREGQGRRAEAVTWMDRAVAVAPDDRWVLYWAAGTVSRRGDGVERLRRYLEHSAGDDPERIVGARGSLTALEMLGDRIVWRLTGDPERLELPIEPVWNTESGTIVGYVISVGLGAAGKPVRLLLDSGASGLYVVERIARKRGFTALADTRVVGGGGKGRHAMRRGLFPQVRLGELTFVDALASVGRHEVDPLGRYHGVISLGVLDGFQVEIDFAKRRLLALKSEGNSDVVGESYWSIDGQLLTAAATTRGREGLFLVDTGATRSALSETFVRGLPEARRGAPLALSGLGGSLSGVRQLHGVELRFQERNGVAQLAVMDLSLRSRMSGIEISGLIGLDLLAQGPLVLDTVGQRLRAGAVEHSGD